MVALGGEIEKIRRGLNGTLRPNNNNNDKPQRNLERLSL